MSKHLRWMGMIFPLLVAGNLAAEQDYFPLQVGNTWTYEVIGPLTPGILYRTAEITDTIRIEGNTYYRFTDFHGLVRKDSLNQVISYYEYNQRENIYFELSASVGDTWETHVIGEDFIVTFEDDSVSVDDYYFGHFDDCYDYEFNIAGTMVSFLYRLAPGIGLLCLLAEGEHYYLIEATINGVHYPKSDPVEKGTWGKIKSFYRP